MQICFSNEISMESEPPAHPRPGPACRRFFARQLRLFCKPVFDDAANQAKLPPAISKIVIMGNNDTIITVRKPVFDDAANQAKLPPAISKIVIMGNNDPAISKSFHSHCSKAADSLDSNRTSENARTSPGKIDQSRPLRRRPRHSARAAARQAPSISKLPRSIIGNNEPIITHYGPSNNGQ